MHKPPVHYSLLLVTHLEGKMAENQLFWVGSTLKCGLPLQYHHDLWLCLVSVSKEYRTGSG